MTETTWPAMRSEMPVCSMFCPGCGFHVALLKVDNTDLLRAMDFEKNGYIPSRSPHTCGVELVPKERDHG